MGRAVGIGEPNVEIGSGGARLRPRQEAKSRGRKRIALGPAGLCWPKDTVDWDEVREGV